MLYRPLLNWCSSKQTNIEFVRTIQAIFKVLRNSKFSGCSLGKDLIDSLPAMIDVAYLTTSYNFYSEMKNNTVNNWLGTFTTNGLILLCGIATGIISARLLQPEGRGALAAILFWPEIAASIGLMNLDTAIIQSTSKNNSKVKEITSTGFYVAIFLAGVTAVVTYFLLPYLLGSGKIELLPAARIYLLAFLPFNFVGLCLMAIDHSRQNFKRYNLFRFIPPITYLSGLMTLWSFDAVTVTKVLWVNLAGTFLVALIKVLFIGNQIKNSFSWQEAKILLAIGSRLKVATFLILVALRIDRLLIISCLDNNSIGLYTVAFTFASSGLKIITSSFQLIMFPKLACQENKAIQKEVLAKGMRFNMLLIIVGSIPLIILSPWLIPFLFGNEFQDSVVPAMILFLAYVPLTMRELIIQCLHSLKKPRPTAINSIILTCVFGILSLPMGQQFGLIGIILSLLMANLVGLYFFLNYLYVNLDLRIKDWWGLNWKTYTQAIGIFRNFVLQYINK